ncbi:MAG: hypothetical protein NT003_05190 [Candidatus Magasanikbacteria bacterium]|nr:hypothetical protein [Candidatus Magasanikbacteria bacterium]
MTEAIIPLILEARIFAIDFFHSELLIGFILGFLFATVLAGFTLSINPRHVPLILRYSILDSFQKISVHDSKRYGRFELEFNHFIKIYFAIRLAFTLIFLMAGAVVIASIFIIQK